MTLAAGLEPPLPRTLELVAAVLDKDPSNKYFSGFNSSFERMPGKRQRWELYESKFAVLAERDWQLLKAKAVPRFSGQDLIRGWQTAIDILNEAVAYSYLVSKGCANVTFVSESQSQKTPDIRCDFKDTEILCEVKTFNVSDEAIAARFMVQMVDDQLSEKFFGKLRNTIDQNLSKFEYGPSAIKCYFFVLNFDDRLHEYSDRYFAQVERWVQGQALPVQGIVFLDNSVLWRSEPLVFVWPKGLWDQ